MVSLALIFGCSSNGGTAPPGGSGGSHGTGGLTGTGGATGSGGVTSSGGATGSGGAVSTGGSDGSGGAVNTGGGVATGGSTGSGGATSRDGGLGNDSSMAGASGSGGTNGTGGSGPSDGGAGSDPVPSSGCNKTSMLKNNAYNTIGSRQYYLRLPANYDNKHPHRLIFGLHGAGGTSTTVAPGFWGLYALSNGSTIFVAPEAALPMHYWEAASDTTFVGEILKAVEADLCIDTSRVMLEGFSQGAAMTWTLACSMPGVFRAVAGHSGGGVPTPATCKPVPYFGSGGLKENVSGKGVAQDSQTDKFAMWNGCMVSSLPTAPSGGHVCTSYTGCPAGYPVRWCNFDGPHTPSPNDSGKSSSWMPAETWPFFSQF